MERFRPALRRVASELDLPRRIRTGLLLEMAADLEAVYEHHRARGLPEHEAARRAEATVLASSEVIRRLGRLHASPLRGWAEAMGARLSGGLDLALLAVGVLPILAGACGVSVWALAAHPSPLAGSVLLVGSVMMARAGAEAVRHLRDRPPRRRDLRSILVLAAMAPALGLLAAVLGLRRAVTGVMVGAAEQAALAATVARDGAILLAGLLLGIAGLLAWFVLLELEARRAAREVDALLAEDVPDHLALPVTPGAADTVIPLVRRRHE